MKKLLRFILLAFIILTPNLIILPFTSINTVHAQEYPEFPDAIDRLWQEFVNELSNGTGMGEKRHLVKIFSNVSDKSYWVYPWYSYIGWTDAALEFTYHGYVGFASLGKSSLFGRSIELAYWREYDLEKVKENGTFLHRNCKRVFSYDISLRD